MSTSFKSKKQGYLAPPFDAHYSFSIYKNNEKIAVTIVHWFLLYNFN